MGFSGSAKVIEVVEYPRNDDGKLYHNQDGNREMITVLECICADGTALAPAVIFKAAATIDESWVGRVKDLPEVLFGRSPNGWTSNQIALDWLQFNFGPESLSFHKAAGRRRLLLLDGHVSHVNPAFLRRCLEYQVTLVCLPPHTTHKLAPCDVGVFGPYKHYYSEELKDRYNNRERGVYKHNFTEILAVARKKAFTKDNILAAFRATGICPPNGEKILDRIIQHNAPKTQKSADGQPAPPPVIDLPTLTGNFANAEVPTTYTQLTATSARRPPATPAVVRILDLDVERAAELPTPAGPKELKRRKDGLLDCMRTQPGGMGPDLYKMSLEIEKISKLAERLLLEKAEDQQRIAELENQIDEIKRIAGKGRKRLRPVPDGGFSLRSYDDFERLQLEREQKKQEERKRKIEKLRVDVGLQEEKLKSTREKKEQVAEREAKNTKPKRWRSSAQLAGDESSISEKLRGLEEQLKQLEEEYAEHGGGGAEGEASEGESDREEHQVPLGFLLQEFEAGG